MYYELLSEFTGKKWYIVPTAFLLALILDVVLLISMNNEEIAEGIMPLFVMLLMVCVFLGIYWVKKIYLPKCFIGVIDNFYSMIQK